MAELSGRMKATVMTISNTVQRGEKIVKELDVSSIQSKCSPC